jgi:ribulose-phosphate 3-epimerase
VAIPAQLGDRRVAPSILSADFARLGSQLRELLAAGARMVHVDVMDGHFVEPITMGPIVVSALRQLADEYGALLDVHLMIERPERQIAEFARAGADVISIHQEATPHVNYALAHIRAAGCAAGLAFNPATPIAALGEIHDLLDVVLCMTVNPGWGGQQFIDGSVERVQRIRDSVPDEVVIEVDGGIDTDTAGPCARAGAGVFVAGSAIFSEPDPVAAYVAIAEVAGAS